MLRILPGLEDLVMMTVTPADVPSLAATILVLMPPVPRDEPALETVSREVRDIEMNEDGDQVGDIPSASTSLMSSTTSIGLASGLLRGFLS